MRLCDVIAGRWSYMHSTNPCNNCSILQFYKATIFLHIMIKSEECFQMNLITILA
uniref:Uncharacterized protein n=1 Tax=Anguilla anguilla TaxID=7936 RepID=A0A0E9QV71_ANGAN